MTNAQREAYFATAFRDWQSGVAVIPYLSLSPEEAKARFEEAEREMRRKKLEKRR